MPEIFRFHGIKIYVYYKDHAPPHLHANYGDEWGVFKIADGTLMPGRSTLNKLAVSVVRKWIRAHREAIMRAWDRALRGEDPGRIGGGGGRKKKAKPRGYGRAPRRYGRSSS